MIKDIDIRAYIQLSYESILWLYHANIMSEACHIRLIFASVWKIPNSFWLPINTFLIMYIIYFESKMPYIYIILKCRIYKGWRFTCINLMRQQWRYFLSAFTHWGLTHWGRVTHICALNLTVIGSDNGLSPGRRQAIIWTNAGILFIGPLGTNFSEVLIGIQTFSLKKMHLKVVSAKWRPFCLGLIVLMSIPHQYENTAVITDII